MTQRAKKLLDQVRAAIRLKHYAQSTEKTYVYWANRSPSNPAQQVAEAVGRRTVLWMPSLGGHIAAPANPAIAFLRPYTPVPSRTVGILLSYRDRLSTLRTSPFGNVRNT